MALAPLNEQLLHQEQREQLSASTASHAEAESENRQVAVIAAVMAATDGRGADCVLEAVGNNSALRLAYDLVRPMGTISSVGVNTTSSFPFSPVDAYNKNITFRSGRCPARAYIARLLPLLREPQLPAQSSHCSDAALPWRRILTHRLPLSKGPEAYDMFARRADGCIKIVLDPWT
ncbi:hypothetical protein Vretimale_3031 [Volvox reticuliferus]|nr:hypothetical protein Vretimale_3031 [Volvox reticuliferus]